MSTTRDVLPSERSTTPQDGINARNADYLSTDPIGSNDWQSIFFQYLPNATDGGTTGKKGTPSDWVATFCIGTGCPLR